MLSRNKPIFNKNEGNYVMLEAEGSGHYVGCNLNIHNLRRKPELEWPENMGWPVSQFRDLWPQNKTSRYARGTLLST